MKVHKNDLGFSLCTTLSVCYVITTSDDREKSKMGVSADWCVAIEHWGSSSIVRRGSHQGGSPQNVLGDERTCGTTLASAYVLRRLSAAWSQLQMKERSPSGSEC